MTAIRDLIPTLFIFLDDIRDPPSDEWIVVRDAVTAYHHIVDAWVAGRTIVISLDHDLGEDIPTGYDLLNWIEKDIATDDYLRPNISFRIHSANPVGRDNMTRAIGAIERIMQ